MSKHKTPQLQAESLPILDIEYQEYTDGTCGGSIVGVPGEIFSTDETTFFMGMNWLVSQIGKIEAEAQKRGGGPRMADVGMQGSWIDGEYCIRFLPSPGWGVSFKRKEDLTAWITHLIKIVTMPHKSKTND